MELKTVSQRLQEMKQVYEKLEEFGINEEDPTVVALKCLCCLFVRDGSSASGSLGLHNTTTGHRSIYYNFKPYVSWGPSIVLLRGKK